VDKLNATHIPELHEEFQELQIFINENNRNIRYFESLRDHLAEQDMQDIPIADHIKTVINDVLRTTYEYKT
jgi:hypothetical protein